MNTVAQPLSLHELVSNSKDMIKYVQHVLELYIHYVDKCIFVDPLPKHCPNSMADEVKDILMNYNDMTTVKACLKHLNTVSNNHIKDFFVSNNLTEAQLLLK